MKYGIEIFGDVSQQRRLRSPPECATDEHGVHLQLAATDFEPLGTAFCEHLWDRIAEENEWQSTTRFMEYIAMDVIEMQLLGFQAPGAVQPGWSLDLLFNSCGGTSTVSAQLAAHWAQIWYEQQRSGIDSNLLVPFGFQPYGARHPDGSFEINVALADSLEDGGAALLADLQMRYGDRQSQCQLCDQ